MIIFEYLIEKKKKMNLDMKKSILYLFPIGSIISIILTFSFPILRYEFSPSQFYSFWFWGFPYFPLFEINILDISQKVISLIIITLMFFLVSSIFSIRKNPARLDSISNRWQSLGIGILILNIFWIISFFSMLRFFTPYGFSFEFAIVLPFIGGLLLIFGRLYFRRIIFERIEKQDYTDLKWLEKQHFELNKSIQQIADEQNVSMIKIRAWIDKIEKNQV